MTIHFIEDQRSGEYRRGSASGLTSWVVACLAAMGQTEQALSLTRAEYENFSFESLADLGYDSLHLTGLRTGDEFVVFGPDQVQVLSVHVM